MISILLAIGRICRNKFRSYIHKPKTFSLIFIAFLKSTSNSQYFEKQDGSHSLIISKIIDSERGGYLNVSQVLFQAKLRQSTC